MTIRPEEHEALMARIARLEAQSRWFKRTAVGGLLLITCVGLMAQSKQRKPAPKTPATPPTAAAPAPPPAPKVFEGESFLLKDENGKVRAELSMSGGGPSLKFRDQSGSALMTLSLNDQAPGGPVLLFSDPQHQGGVALSVLAGSGPQLALTGERPDVQVHMGVTPEGTALELSDKDGFTTSIGNGVVAKNNQAKKTSAASVVLFGKERKVLWSAP